MSYLEFIFLKVLFPAYNSFIFAQMFQWTSSEFLFKFRFSSRKSQSQQNLAKKITHFTIQFQSKNLSFFTNLDSLDIKNNMLSQFLDAQERNFWSTLKASVCIFLYISVRIFFQRRSNILSDGVGLGEGWIISWSRLIVWFFFILTEIFENLLFFSILTLPSTALKRWNIPDKLDYKVKIVAKFLIRSHLLTV